MALSSSAGVLGKVLLKVACNPTYIRKYLNYAQAGFGW
jgi:hypothetical protein